MIVMIERNMEQRICSWVKSGSDAFLLTGARQTGKTFLIRSVLNKMNIPYVEFNFIDRPELVDLFSSAKTSADLLLRMTAATTKELIPGESILFLDEVQECKDIVTRIKFLVEDGTFRYILSGSLLGVELNDIRSAPVGYMQIADLFPLTLHEFYRALGVKEETLEYVKSCYRSFTSVDDFVHGKLMDVFYLYLIVGGMPEAVQVYLDTNDISKVNGVHEKIIRLYRQDFTKYEKKEKLILQEIYDAIPGELEEKNKRFFINHVGDGSIYDRVKNNFLWLKDAGVALPVYNVTEPKKPLKISEKRNLFKLFMSDVGLLTSLYSNTVKFAILQQESTINNGGLFENAVAQELYAKGMALYYFNSKMQGEIDIVIELNGEVMPIEVKSGKDYTRHSALNNVLTDMNYKIKQAYVLHNGNVTVENQLKYLPVYMIAFVENENMAEHMIYTIDLGGI